MKLKSNTGSRPHSYTPAPLPGSAGDPSPPGPLPLCDCVAPPSLSGEPEVGSSEEAVRQATPEVGGVSRKSPAGRLREACAGGRSPPPTPTVPVGASLPCSPNRKLAQWTLRIAIPVSSRSPMVAGNSRRPKFRTRPSSDTTAPRAVCSLNHRMVASSPRRRGPAQDPVSCHSDAEFHMRCPTINGPRKKEIPSRNLPICADVARSTRKN